MCTKIQLKDYLDEISNGAKFTKFEYASAEKFTVSLKCKIEEIDADHYKNYTKQWIRRFSDFTNTAWIVRHDFPNLKRLVYRKSFWCHRSALNKSKTSGRTRNLECKAKINFRVKLITKHTLRNDPDLREGLNMNISIDFNHSHMVRTPESYNLLKSSSQSDSAFYDYFNDGYSSSMAKCYHELLLTERYGPDSEYIANASVNPNLRHIIYIFKKGKHNNVDASVVIQRKIDALQQTHTIKYNHSPEFVVIITPLMGRVVTQFCIECALIDVTSISWGTFMMIIYVPSQVGSLPIACAIYTEQSKEIYHQIFIAISSATENYGKRFEPRLVSLSKSLVKDVLTSMFPNIVIKLDRYSICRDLWEWICNSDNVDKDKRHDTMTLFKCLVYADSVEDANRIHNNLLNNDIMQSCLDRLEYVWRDSEQWITCEEFSGNHVEAPIMFVKEFLTQKCKSFTFTIMLDVITNILESHFQKMIVACLENETTALHTKFLAKVNIELSSQSTQRVGLNEFLIPYKTKKKKFYHLNTDTLCCDCKIGIKGRLCEHLIGVLTVIESKYEPVISEHDKEVYLKLAGEVAKIKRELDNFEELNEIPIADRPMSASASSNASDLYEIKKENIEIDPLDEDHGHDTIEDPLKENHDNDRDTIETQINLKTQYEAAMKTVNNEFRRLNKLFKDNPNTANMETMTRLAKELAKIRPVEKVDLSNMFVELNT